MYRLVAIGGTFDHLHAGHEAFLRAAFQYGRKVLIGLTSDRMAEEKIRNPKSVASNATGTFDGAEIRNKPQIQNFQTRKHMLLDLLTKKKWTDRVEIMEIDDLYGPTLEQTDIDALVVTTETEGGARMINAARKKKKLSAIPVIVAKLVLAQDRRRIASTRIREGNIDRSGLLYRNLSIFGGKIPEVVRQRLKKPLGRIITDWSIVSRPCPMVITVGDVVTKYMMQIDPKIVDIAIVDFRVNRKAIHSSFADVGFTSEKIRNYIVTSVKNPPGYMATTLVYAVHQAIERRLRGGKRSIIRVMGEEDLAGVPAILLAPLGSTVLYGQPGEGMVAVDVTEEKKEEIMRLLVVSG